MKKIVMVLAIALCLFGAASTAHAQYYHSYWYNYNVYQSASGGSAYYSYNYSSPYGSYYWYQTYQYPTYYYYPAYNYSHYYPYLYQSRVQYPIRIR